jgi:hypothetical protein
MPEQLTITRSAPLPDQGALSIVSSQALTKPASTWDRVVSAFGDFMNPLGEPDGRPFDEHLADVGRSILNLPKQTGEALHSFGRALSTGDVSGAAYHLAGAVPFLGPMSQQVSNDLADGKIPEAIGHTAALFGSAAMMRPEETASLGSDVVAGAKTAAPVVRDAVVGGVKGGLELKVRRYIPIPASLAGAAAGGFAAHEVGLPHGLGAAVGAAAPVVKGAIAEVKAGLARRAPVAAGVAEAAAETAALDQIAQSVDKKPFSDLSPAHQDLVLKIRAQDLRQNAPPTDPSAAPAPAANVPLPEYTGAGKTLEQLLDEDIAQRRAQRAAPPAAGFAPQARPAFVGPVDPARAQPTPIATATPAPMLSDLAAPAPSGQWPVTSGQPAVPQTIADLSRAFNESVGQPAAAAEPTPAVDFAAKARAAKVNKLADFLESNGFNVEDTKLFKADDWANIAKGAGQRSPSAASIQGAIAELEQRQAAAQPAPTPAPGAAPATPPATPAAATGTAPVFEDAVSLARSLHHGGSGISAEDAAMLSPQDWQTAAQGFGIRNPNPATVKAAVTELKRLESAAPFAQRLAGKAGDTPEPPPAAAAAVPAPEPPPQPPAPAAAADFAPYGRDPANVDNMPLDQIHADPVRFQFKRDTGGKAGVGENLKDVQVWNKDMAGRASVWLDPADGKTYIVNGHHRLDLANRLGVPGLDVRYIDAAMAQEARAQGALFNIGDNNGTSIDAAKFFRDTGMGAADLEKSEIALKGPIAREGTAIARLPNKLFDSVLSGDLSTKRAALIGETLEAPEDQNAALDLMQRAEHSGKELTDQQFAELVRRVKGAERNVEESQNLFGTTETSQNLALEETRVSDFIRKKLGQDKKLFGAVGNQSAADRLGGAGNVINAEQNARIANEANQALAVYDKLSLRAGPIDDAIRAAAKSIAKGGPENAIKDQAYSFIRKALSDTLAGKEDGGSRGIQESSSGGSLETGPSGKNPADAAPAGIGEKLKQLWNDDTGALKLPRNWRAPKEQGGFSFDAPAPPAEAPPLTLADFARQAAAAYESHKAAAPGLRDALTKEMQFGRTVSQADLEESPLFGGRQKTLADLFSESAPEPAAPAAAMTRGDMLADLQSKGTPEQVSAYLGGEDLADTLADNEKWKAQKAEKGSKFDTGTSGILPAGMKRLKLYHGSRETFDTFDSSLSADRDHSIIAWFAKEPRHAAVYGDVEPWDVAPKKTLDLRSYTKIDPATRRPIERNISEWVKILRNRGLDVEMIPDSGVEDQPVPFWDLLAGHDAGSDVATNLPQVLPKSGYDAIRLHEMGIAPDWKPSDTFGVLNPNIIKGKSIKK